MELRRNLLHTSIVRIFEDLRAFFIPGNGVLQRTAQSVVLLAEPHTNPHGASLVLSAADELSPTDLVTTLRGHQELPDFAIVVSDEGRALAIVRGDVHVDSTSHDGTMRSVSGQPSTVEGFALPGAAEIAMTLGRVPGLKADAFTDLIEGAVRAGAVLLTKRTAVDHEELSAPVEFPAAPAATDENEEDGPTASIEAHADPVAAVAAPIPTPEAPAPPIPAPAAPAAPAPPTAAPAVEADPRPTAAGIPPPGPPAAYAAAPEAPAAVHTPVTDNPDHQPTLLDAQPELSTDGAASGFASPSTAIERAVEGSDEVMVLGVRCPADHHNHPDALYCSQCGRKMGVNHTRTFQQGARPPLGVLLLDDGTRTTIERDLIVGRDPWADELVAAGQAAPLVLSDDSRELSRSHAWVKLTEWDVHVFDRGSSNGTFVQRAFDQQWHAVDATTGAALTSGDVIKVGGRRLKLDLHHVR